jgi:hypothetical protein
MTKKQRAEQKLNNALRAAKEAVRLDPATGRFSMIPNQMSRGLVPRINRWAARFSGMANGPSQMAQQP